MDWPRLAAQLIRARRGARTQKNLSTLLGYRSNVLFAWENCHDEPSARAFFRLIEATGAIENLTSFYRDGDPPCLTDKQGVALFCRGLAGQRKVTELAHLLDRDRHAVGRWLRGQTEISLPDLLHLVEVTTLGLYDFLAAFVDPRDLDAVREGYLALEAARESARQMPWAHAIVHMVDLPGYKRLPQHESGWFASRLGISIQEERACLDHLVDKGQLSFEKGRFQPGPPLNVDTRPDPMTTRQLASFWLREGAARVLTPGTGRFAFNTFSISKNDLAKAKELQSEYFRQLRSLVSSSEKTEAVAVATFQLIPLAVEGDDA